MSYNVLYGLLVSGMPIGQLYSRRHSPVAHTDRSRAIRDMLMSGVPTDRRGLMASLLCWAAGYTEFGNEIKSLDSNNTYTKPERIPGSGMGECMAWDLTGPVSELRPLVNMLDEDLADRLDTAQWIDVAAACCLQMLREVS